ncbi:MAG TPA: hypothetical protein VKR79_02825 [Gaiellaceae bacterium]|nr:hypothetical protein [Gaiellaceae bacterium]
MPMLHGCAFPGCATLTLSTYCVEHELLVRALKESERQATHPFELDADAPLTMAPTPVDDEAQEPAAL